MTEGTGIERRDFLRGAAALAGAPAVLAQRGPNDKLGIAVLGVGTRGFYLMRETQILPNTEMRVICDIYEGNIKRAKEFCRNPKAKVVREWEKAVTDPDVDAVIIATPDFWHAPMTVRAAQAKKHVYVEKGLCRTLEEAKQIRKAVKDSGVVLQCGHNYNSLPTFHRAREIYRSGELGKVTLVRSYIDRTSAWPEWQFFTEYNIQEMPKDAGPDTIDWERFIANAPRRSFDARRFFLWRMWWEYSTGIAGDLMSHVWDGINMVIGMGIPETAQTQGGLYFWKDGRDVPDMWHVLFDYPSKELAITFGCSFHNRHVGEVSQILGREKTLEVSPVFCRTYGAEWKPEHKERLAKARKLAEQTGIQFQDFPVPADYSFKKGELEVTNHLQDFLDCIRTGQRPRCDVDRAFEEAAAVMMSVEAYRRERKVRWDPVKEEVV
jgi:predicted dehydrogenase